MGLVVFYNGSSIGFGDGLAKASSAAFSLPAPIRSAQTSLTRRTAETRRTTVHIFSARFLHSNGIFGGSHNGLEAF